MVNSVNKVITHITINTDEFGNYNPIYIYAKEKDVNSRYITATIVGKNGKINITGEPRLNVTDYDGIPTFVNGTVNEDGTVTVPITSEMLMKSGKLKCDISIYATDSDVNSVLTTATFYVIVDETSYDPDAHESFNGTFVPTIGGVYGGIYIGDGNMPDWCVLQINPYAYSEEGSNTTIVFDCGGTDNLQNTDSAVED